MTDMHSSATQRLMKHGDPVFQRWLGDECTPLHTDPFDGPYPNPPRDSPLSHALANTALDRGLILSFGDREDRSQPPLRYMELFDPQDKRSEHKAHWAGKLGKLKDQGFRLVFTDGTGREGHSAAGICSEGGYLGPLATVQDAELFAIALALEREEGVAIIILSDSRKATQIVYAMSSGDSPRSGIEKRIKAALHRRHKAHMDTAIAWVRGHIGIQGNSKADHTAALHSTIGQLSNSPWTATPSGLKAFSKAQRRLDRYTPSFGKSNTSWSQQALTAYTWLRTDKSPHATLVSTRTCPAPADTTHRMATTSPSTAPYTRKPGTLS